MARVEYHFKPQGGELERYYRSTSRVSFIMGPLGSGKTIASCFKLFNVMQKQTPWNGVRKSRFYAIRNTYPDLMTTTIKDWLDLFGDLGRFTQGSKEPPTHYIKFKLPDGTIVLSEVVFLAMDRPEHVKKIRGSQVTGFWLNEIKELPKAVMDMCDLRHGRYPRKSEGGPTWHGMVGDTNAPDEDHYYHTLAEEIQPEDWEFFVQPGGVLRSGLRGDGRVNWIPNNQAENIANLPDGYYVKGMEGKTDDWIAVNLANEYGAVFDGKPIYPEYNDRIHVADQPLKPFRGLPLILGWDFGLTPACIIMQVTRRGQLRALDELVSEDMGIRQFANDVVKPFLANHYPGMKHVSSPDPAGSQRSQTDEKTCIDELKVAGFKVVKPKTNNFTARREAVAGYLTRLVDGEPAFLLSPTCKVLRQGFKGGYRYRRLQVVGDERFTDTPDKNKYSHPHDGLQYGALYVVHPSQETQKGPPRSGGYRPADSTMGY